MMSANAMGGEAGGGSRGMYYALQDQDEKWHKYYSSFHHILLVGEGDFSFSLCLAKSFGSASNIVATCLDSQAELTQKYKQAKENVEILEKLGATVLHGIDATNMQSDFRLLTKKFDIIVYNFPHAGFHGKEDDVHLIREHMSLVYGFFRNARNMLRPDGEVHVNHKTTAPFSDWNLPKLASLNFLKLFHCCDFKIQDFPGYSNKRGNGKRCDEPFPLGECSTFMFVASTKISQEASNLYPALERQQTMQILPFPSHSPAMVRPTPTPSLGMFSSMHGYTEKQRQINMRSENLRLVRDYGGYPNHVEQTFGKPEVDVTNHVHEGVRHGFERYTDEDPKGWLSCYPYFS